MFSDPTTIINFVIALVLALTFHEFSHAFVADRLGDPTPKSAGRLTLNPLAHLDPLGTIFLLIFHFGWGKPVPINPRHFKNPIWGEIAVACAGPISNILMAFGLGLIIRIFSQSLSAPMVGLLATTVLINLFLAFFNLLPIPPLDGSKILQIFLSPRAYFAFAQWGMYALVILLFISSFSGVSIFGNLITTPSYKLFSLFTGSPSPLL